MKALNEKMRNQKAASDFLAGHEPTPMERRNRFRDIQYIEGNVSSDTAGNVFVILTVYVTIPSGQEIFAVQYTSIHKAAIDGSSDAVKFFLSGRGRTKGSVSSKVSCDDWDKVWSQKNQEKQQ